MKERNKERTKYNWRARDRKKERKNANNIFVFFFFVFRIKLQDDTSFLRKQDGEYLFYFLINSAVECYAPIVSTYALYLEQVKNKQT